LIPHKIKLTFKEKDKEEYKKETFDGIKRNTEIIK